MATEPSTERLRELYLPPADDFVVVDVPEMQFVMIDGEGDPEGEPYRSAVRWLFTAIHPIKHIARERMGKAFVEPPLEGLWWADDMSDLVAGNRDQLKWRMMIVTADWVTDAMFDRAVATASERLGEVPGSLRLDHFDEGRSVQIMTSVTMPRKLQNSSVDSITSSCLSTAWWPGGSTMRSTSPIPAGWHRRRCEPSFASRCG